MKIELIPYTLIDGVATFSDSQIKSLYLQMALDGTASTVFSSGDVTNDLEFLRKMKNSHLYVIFVDGEPSGIVWLNGFEGRFARCHWCVFSNKWGKDTVEIGKYSLQWIMNIKDEDKYRYDMLLGFVPSLNKRAIEYCAKCGGAVLGEIPNLSIIQGEGVMGTVIYYTREGG